MLKMYKTDIETNVTEETKVFEKGNWINMIAPTEEEIKLVCKKLKIQEDFIRYSLDDSAILTDEDVADEVLHFAYKEFPDVPFTGENKTSENEIVLYFNPDKQDYFPFKRALADKFTKEIRIATSSPEYAPELRKVAVIINKIN